MNLIWCHFSTSTNKPCTLSITCSHFIYVSVLRPPLDRRCGWQCGKFVILSQSELLTRCTCLKRLSGVQELCQVLKAGNKLLQFLYLVLHTQHVCKKKNIKVLYPALLAHYKTGDPTHAFPHYKITPYTTSLSYKVTYSSKLYSSFIK